MQKWKVCAGISSSRSSKLRVTICSLEGLSVEEINLKENYNIKVQIEWRIPKRSYLSGEKNHTSKQCINSDGRVCWNETFEHKCRVKLKDHKSLKHLRINLQFYGEGAESNSKPSVIAKLKVNADEFAGLTERYAKTVRLPIKCSIGKSTIEAILILRVKLYFPEIQTQQMKGIVHPISPTRLLPSLSSCIGFQTRTTNNIYHSSSESEEEDPEQSYRRITATSVRIAGLVYESLKHENCEIWEEDQPLTIYQEMHKPSLARLTSQNNKRLKFKVSDHPRDTPLLNKACRENGGDDIDNARRCFFSSLHGPLEIRSDFGQLGFTGSDRFEVGSWDKRKFTSRDGKLQLVTDIFLASIDQRSDKASGEGACSVLAAVIADWLHQNPKILPLKCQFDKLIREGSLEWRNLCKEENHREKFSDQHFDLDTVLESQVRPLMVVPEKSYVGFFELENMPNQLEFLQGAMSFDKIWEEIEQSGSTSEEQIYVVSWNDHFFVLKIEKDAIYTIDTLGERLSEGCNKAYILKFTRESTVYKVQPKSEDLDNELGKSGKSGNTDGKEVICKGQLCCKEFIKGFLAALPLEELQGNIEKGIVSKAPIHRLLQIEFQYMTPCHKRSPSMETRS